LVSSWFLGIYFLWNQKKKKLNKNYQIIDFQIKKSNVKYFFDLYVDKNKYFVAKRMNPNIEQIENVDIKSIYEGR
jgi:hypothetical protein